MLYLSVSTRGIFGMDNSEDETMHSDDEFEDSHNILLQVQEGDQPSLPMSLVAPSDMLCPPAVKNLSQSIHCSNK